MEGTKYELNVFAREADGSLRPFRLIISEAWRHPEFGWECRISCEALRKKSMKAFGEDPDSATSMVLSLVNRLLAYAEWRLVDASGNAVILPDIGDAQT